MGEHSCKPLCLIRHLYPESTKNNYNSIIKWQMILKRDKGSEWTWLRQGTQMASKYVKGRSNRKCKSKPQWSQCNIYKYWITILYTWSYCNVTCQLYLNFLKKNPPWDTISYPLRWLESKRWMLTNVSWDGEKLEPSHTAGVIVKRCGCFGKQPGSPSKAKTGGITMWPSNASPRETAKDLKAYVHTKTHTETLMAAFSMMVKELGQPRYA